MGLMQREKGKRFERAIASKLRVLWPDATVRRASQADRAHQSDVYIAGGPSILERLWLELQDARNPAPLIKLKQAEKDVEASGYAFKNRLPIVIWHRLGERTSYATMRLWALDVIRGQCVRMYPNVVTMDSDELWAVIANVYQREESVVL